MVLCFIESMKKYESQSQLRGKERPLFGLWLKPKTKNIYFLYFIYYLTIIKIIYRILLTFNLYYYIIELGLFL